MVVLLCLDESALAYADVDMNVFLNGSSIQKASYQNLVTVKTNDSGLGEPTMSLAVYEYNVD